MNALGTMRDVQVQSKSKATERFGTLDVLRGFAILGILLANIAWFSQPTLKDLMLLTPIVPLTPAELRFDQWQAALVNGKFRSLLCILFGVGLWLQLKKRKEKGLPWPGSYLRRTGWLLAIGLAHLIFIWFGDILATYAVVAFFCAYIAQSSRGVLIGFIVGCAVFALFTALGAAQAAAGGPWGKISDLGVFGTWIAREGAAYAQGTYLDQLQYRLGFALLFPINVLSFAPALAGLFLLGVLLGQSGFFEKPSAHPKILRGLLLVGLGLGIPINFGVFLVQTPEALNAYTLVIEVFGAAFLSVGYLAVIAWLSEKPWMKWWNAPLQNVGRLALTTYLSQSVICVVLFYSWGFGLYGEYERQEFLPIVGAIWLFNLLFAAIYLRFRPVGPVEAWWRARCAERDVPNAPPPVAPPPMVGSKPGS